MSSLKSGRCGKYFDLFLKESKKIKDNHNNERLTLPKICREIGFKETEYGQEAFILKTINERRKLTENEFDSWIESLKENAFLKQIFREINFEEDFKNYIKKVYYGTEVEITYGQSAQHERLFEKPISINTFTSLRWHTLKILETDWETMLLVAETGEWLTNNMVVDIINKNRKRKLFLLIADHSYEDIIRETLIIDTEIKSLPWWVHNKHMTICCKGNICCPNFHSRGIYFIRRMRSPVIDAVRLIDRDCNVILNIFFSYWAKAKKREDEKLDTVNSDDIQQSKDEIFPKI